MTLSFFDSVISIIIIYINQPPPGFGSTYNTGASTSSTLPCFVAGANVKIATAAIAKTALKTLVFKHFTTFFYIIQL